MTAEIEPIRPDVSLPTAAFLDKLREQIPEGVPVVVMWVDEEGAANMRCSRTLRTHWAWLALHLNAWAIGGGR